MADQDEKLYTLSDVSQETGISMPTLQRYKKLYQARIPSVGKGRKQRYPASALPVFDEIKNENVGRRGRPRKDASAPAAARRGPKAAAPGRKPGRPAGSKRAKGATATAADTAAAAPARGRKSAAANSSGLLTLTAISKATGISYPTLVRYVRLHLDRLQHEGKGRARRFHQDAVEVFRQLRQESGRGGRKPGSGAKAAGRGRGRGGDDSALASRLKVVEKAQQELEKRLQGFAKSLRKLFQ